jgi:hypothetical protein
MTNDDQLLVELREAIQSAREVPEGFIAAGKAAFAWRTVDAELAALTAEFSADDALMGTGTRAEHASVRALSFHARDIAIELEVTADALLGQLVPVRPGTIELQTKDGAHDTATVDESGWFTIRPLPTTMFRLHVQTATDNVITEWITL